MNRYCEYVFTNEHGSEMCHLSNEICPKFFKDIASNCCEKRAAVNSGKQNWHIHKQRKGRNRAQLR